MDTSSATNPPARVTEHGRPERTDISTHPVVLVFAVTMLLALFGLGALGLGNSLSADEIVDVDIVIVPRGDGRPADVVQRQMERLGLFVELDYRSNESAPPDTVTGQLPIAGSRIEVGKLVVLTVSDGPAGLRVPDASGLQRVAATSLLSAMGLEVKTGAVFDDDVRPGEVVSTDPEEGTRVQLGTTVVLLLSKGPRPRTVPDVIGMDGPEAFAELGAAELQIGRIRYRSDPELPPGAIVSTTPEATSEVPRNTPVDVVMTPEPDALRVVPDLVPMDQSAAAQIVSASGLRLSTSYVQVPAGDNRGGIVLSQTPIAGVTVQPGTTIEITVGNAPRPPAEPEPEDPLD